MVRRVLLSWSSGKDSAWSLHVLRQMDSCEVVGLLTTFNRAADRVAMHGVRRELVKAQAAAAGLPLWDVDLPWPCSNADYESAMRAQWERAVSAGIECVAFGDLFLIDIRQYREKQLLGSGLEPMFPVWGIPTGALAREMIASGVRARLTCIDTKQLDGSFAGREFDYAILREFPQSVDPCGENGEFHSFVYDGPVFRHPIGVQIGEKLFRDQFAYADLIPVVGTAPFPDNRTAVPAGN